MSSDQELSGAEDESLIEDEENPTGVNMFELNAEEINALDQYRLEPKYFVTYFIHFFYRDDPKAEALTDDLQAVSISTTPTLCEEGHTIIC